MVRRGEKVTVDVQVQVTGEVFSGGLLDQQLVQVAVEAEATNIPGAFEVNVEGMEIGAAVHAGELTLPAGVTLVTDPEALVLHVLAAPTAEQLEAELGEVPAAGGGPALARGGRRRGARRARGAGAGVCRAVRLRFAAGLAGLPRREGRTGMTGERWLIVGLGNPGPGYAANRHNAGYMVADVLAAERMGARFRAGKFQAAVAEGRLAGQPVTLGQAPDVYEPVRRPGGRAVPLLPGSPRAAAGDSR